MKFTIDKHEKYVLIQVEETKLDRVISPKLKTELILANAEGQRNIILDLSTVENIEDSSDFSSLLVGHRLCENAEGVFIVTGLNDHLTNLLVISQIDNTLNIIPKIDEAIDLIFMEEIEKELNKDQSK